MTTRATFGDLAHATTRHLNTPPTAGPHPYAARPGGDARYMADAVRATVRAMTSYAGDAWTILDIQRRFGRPHHAPWIRAASRAREALANATAYLDRALASANPPDPRQPPTPAVAALRTAAQSMTTGRDLLRTHLAPAPGRGWIPRSEWAPVVTSIPIARALLHQISGWAALIAPHGSQAAITAMAGKPQARRDLNLACQWLWVLTWAVEAASEQQPVRVTDLELLHAIPACVIPPRLQPSGGEQVTSLCRGVISTAERARAAAFTAARRAAWSPALTRESMRQVTDNCTITSWNIHLLLRALAQAAAPDGPPGLIARIEAAAEQADQARAAWLQAARTWDQVTTDGRGQLSHEATDAADLALWTGRLAYARPDWTPALGPSHPARAPQELATSPGDLPMITAAVHHACHTVSALAASSLRQLQIAAQAGRLIVPARAIPDAFTIGYPFAPAPADCAGPLLTAYDLAQAASDQAATAMAPIALAVKSPSRVLIPVRAAARAHLPSNPGPAAPRTTRPVPPGPAEQILRDLGVTDTTTLAQATALDQATSQLILHAATPALPASPASQPGTPDLSRTTSTAQLINNLLATGPAPPALHPPPPPARPKPAAAVKPKLLLRAEFPATTLAPSQAREQLRQALTDHGLTALADNAELLASEMVANAAEHATGKPIRLVLRQHTRPDGRASITCEVSDTSPVLPKPRPATPEHERGRGLAIIAALAADHGVRAGLTGKTCWFTLTTPANPELPAPEPATRHIQAEPEAEAGA